MKLFIKKLNTDAILPSRAHRDDVGIDMYACGDQVILPGELKKISTGVSISLPEGCAGLIWDKSSIGSKGIKVFCGVFDPGYRGEYFLVMKNTTSEEYIFKHGDKVAQMLVQRVEYPEIIEVDTLEESDRGEGGFGSTGK